MDPQSAEGAPAEEVVLGPDGQPLTKSALKKLARDQKKAEKKKEAAPKKVEETANNYGTLPLIQSSTRTNRVFSKISTLDESKAGQTVLVRARVHTSRPSVQAVIFKGGEVSKGMVLFAQGLSKESIVDVEAEVVVPKDPIAAATQKTIELAVKSIFLVTTSEALPLQIEDAARPKSVLKEQERVIGEIENEIKAAQEEADKLEGAAKEEAEKKIADLKVKKSEAQKYVKVSRKVRLDNRILDLRTPANQAIFRIQSAVCQLFREYLLKNDFTEIHTPKLIGCASEGGAQAFKLQYFQNWAFLAQSPQLYKQMGICADLDRVFEIGPVFRAEESFTHRHLCEFVGLDLEMSFYEHYHEVLDMLEGLFLYIFDNLEARFASELEAVRRQYPFEPLKYSRPSLRLKFSDAIKLLRENGVEVGELDDLNTTNEKFLGKLVKEKYDTDFFILDKFPSNIRPFYTMPDPNNKDYSNSYDFFLRGEEIMSGAQRIHDAKMLTEQAQARGVGIEGIKDYIDSFRYGALPHAGGGIGMERVVMLYLKLSNIRMSSMFPRDPSRLNP